MRLLLLLFVATALAGCAKVSGPLKVYFIGSTRFTAGNRTAGPADTLSARLFIDDTISDPPGITRLRVTVDYSPRTAPFAYPSPLSSFLITSVIPTDEPIVYLDTTYAQARAQRLYTALFGVRTSVGTERWTFTATDKAGSSVARSFVVSQRRTDSTAVYNEYVLRLNLPDALAPKAVQYSNRRFIDLKSGLAFPGYTVSHSSQSELQKRIDLVLLPDGSLASPKDLDYARYFKAGTWVNKAELGTTSFVRTALTATTFATITDTLSIHRQFTAATAPSVAVLNGLATGQVYAIRAAGVPGQYSYYGLMLVVNTTSGYQLQVRMAKRPL